MKKLKVAFVSVLCIIILSTSNILATPGKLRSNSIISCNGTYYGNHGDGHWHVAVKHDSGWYPNGGSLGYNNPCASNLAPPAPSAPPEVKKNNDTSLKSITIDSHPIAIDTMRYTTTSEQISINAIPTNNKTSVTIDTNAPLQIGTNHRVIKATAEDGSTKEYTLTIVREKIKSSNNSLHSISIDDDTILISDSMEYTTGNKGVSIKAIAEDNHANVTINYNLESLRVGINEIPIIVTAEDGSINEYQINIKRLNDEIGIEVEINGEEVTFDTFKSEITVRNKVKEVDIDYLSTDANASVELDYEKKLQDGKNNIVIQVTAENGNMQEYSIVVTRKSLLNELISSTVSVCVVLVLSYYIVKYIKYKKEESKVD